MHVLFISHYTLLYGANRSLLDLIIELRKEGVTPTVMLPGNGPIQDELDRLGIRHLTIPFKKSVHRGRSPLSVLGSVRRRAQNHFVARRCAEQIQALDIDVVHTNSSVTSFGWILSRQLQIPHVWHVRESLAKHYKLFHDFGDRHFQSMLAVSDRVIPVSNFLSHELLDAVPETRKEVIYNGVFCKRALTELASSKTARPSNRTFTFGVVGRLEPGKNQLEALRAAAELAKNGQHRFKILIVGDGPKAYTQRLHRYIKEAGLQSLVELSGYVNNMHEVYERINAIVICARHEGLGRVSIEAMARGIPVIGFRSGGTRETVVDGVNGLLYTGGAVELSKCMEAFLTEPELPARLAEDPLGQHIAQFTTESCAAAFRKVLLQVGRNGADVREPTKRQSA